MFRASHAIQLSVLSIALATAAGCATISGGPASRHDVHASARIAGDTARILVSGPASLLHIDVDGRADLALYAVARKSGTDADCAASATVEKKRLHAGTQNVVNLDVAAGETICVASAASARPTSVMWHARRLDATAAAGQGPALAVMGPAR
jgi:hypothetical protein